MDKYINLIEKYERNGWPSIKRPDLKPPTGWNLSLVTSLERIRSHALSPDGQWIACIKDVLGSTQGNRAELEQALYWMSQGKIKSVIDSIFPLEQAAEAHTKMLTGKGLFGKILMKP